MEIERGRERGREGGRGESRDCDFFVRAAQGTFVSTPFSPDGGMLVDVEAARRVSSGADAHQALEPTKLLAAQRDAGVAAVTRVTLFRDTEVSMWYVQCVIYNLRVSARVNVSAGRCLWGGMFGSLCIHKHNIAPSPFTPPHK
jgi:hypothetical protein